MHSYNYETRLDDIQFLNTMVSNLFTNTSSYPPSNVIQSDDENYILQVALAGHKKDQIHLSTKDDYLYLNVDKSQLPNGKIIKRDIAGRTIKTCYRLNGLEVNRVSYEDGLLTVSLKVPDEKKPKEIIIE